MHMNMEITLRLMITPTTPIVNNTAESARYHESCGPSIFQFLSLVMSSLDSENALRISGCVHFNGRRVSWRRWVEYVPTQDRCAGQNARTGRHLYRAPRQSHRTHQRHQQ